MIWGCVFVVLCPWIIGDKINIFKKGCLANVAVGWIVLLLLITLISLFSILSLKTILIFSICFSFYFWKDFLTYVREVLINIFNISSSLSKIEKVFFSILILLICVRLLRSFIPTLNWDSLNNHLLLIRERLFVGDLSPIWHVPTDRRVPLNGVLLKLWPFSFDQNGRVLVFLNVSLHLFSASLIFKRVATLCNIRLALIALAMYLSLSDIYVYSVSAGDEAFMSFFILVVVDQVLLNHTKNKKQIVCIWLLLAIVMSIKMTALFWLPWLLILFLFSHLYNFKTHFLGLILFLSMVLFSYTFNYRNYQMIYPFQRWSNLLMEGDSQVKMYKPDDIKLQRKELGLQDDVNNKAVIDAFLDKLFKNLKTSLSLPLGPYPLWIAFVVLVACIGYKNHFLDKSFLIPFGLVLICFLASLITWPFSAQAMFRYHLPTWSILMLSLGLGIGCFVQKYGLKNIILFSTMTLVMLALCIEVKATYQLSDRNMFDPKRYWQVRAPEGELVLYIHQILQEDERVFYLGMNSSLLKPGKHWYAQYGNEVGWRSPEKLVELLRKKRIKYWVYSNQFQKHDQIYERITQYLLDQKFIFLVKSINIGKVYQVY